MLVCRLDYSIGHTVGFQNFHAVLYVSRNDVYANLGYKVVVRVFAVGLVFDEVLGIVHLAYVVEVCASSRHIRIEVYSVCTAFGEVCYARRVIVSTGSLLLKLFEKRLSRRTYFCKLEVCPYGKQRFVKRKEYEEYCHGKHISYQTSEHCSAYACGSAVLRKIVVQSSKRSHRKSQQNRTPRKTQTTVFSAYEDIHKHTRNHRNYKTSHYCGAEFLRLKHVCTRHKYRHHRAHSNKSRYDTQLFVGKHGYHHRYGRHNYCVRSKETVQYRRYDYRNKDYRITYKTSFAHRYIFLGVLVESNDINIQSNHQQIYYYRQGQVNLVKGKYTEVLSDTGYRKNHHKESEYENTRQSSRGSKNLLFVNFHLKLPFPHCLYSFRTL